MKSRVVVIGGGVNGLVAATSLARAGRPVVLLEGREVLGGLCAGGEFHPGFRHTGILHDSARLRPRVVAALELERHGLEYRATEPARLALEAGEPGLVLHGDAARTRAELASRSAADAGAHEGWCAFVGRVRGFVARALSESPPDVDPSSRRDLLDLLRGAVALRRLGEADMLELMRVVPMCAADWVRDSFDDPLLQAALTAPALHGTWMGPWSAGSAALLLAHETCRGRSVRGGPAGAVAALEQAARAAGVELRTGTPVEGVALEAGGARGARLADGELVEGDVVLSTLEPRRTLLELLPRIHLPAELEDAIRGWRTRGTTAKLHLALDGPPRLAARPDQDFERLSSGESIDDLERAFDAVKYGRMSERPLLDVRVPTLADPALAPEGKHVASVLVHYAPHALAGGWTDEARRELERRVLDTLAEHVPDLRHRIVGSELLTPVDLESRYGLSGGQVHHGEHALDQLLFMRPGLDFSRYATPIPGLFLGGSGSHPGGGLTGAPGLLAAQRVLEG